MPPVAIVAGAAAAAQIGGAVIGRAASAGDREKAENAAQEALNEILTLGVPPEEAREIFREKFKRAGVYTPEAENAIELGVSKVSEIKEDPQFRETQIEGLKKFEGLSKTGLNAEDRLAMNELRNKVGRENEAREADIIRNMQERGIAGGGAELALKLKSNADSNAEASLAADRQAAIASQRALDALVKGTGLAGELRGQDFDIAKAKAGAEDEFQRFNVNAAQGREQRRVAGVNEASKYNLGEDQRIADANVNLTNDELLRQRAAEQRDYGRTVDRAKLRSDALKGRSDLYQRAADDTQGVWSGIGQGVSSGIKGVGGAMSGPSNMIANIPAAQQQAEYDNSRRELDDFQFTQPKYKYYSEGGIVPGKPVMPGNNRVNDQVPAMLSPGEIVVPPSHSDDADKAYDFIKHLLDNRKKK